MRPDALIVHFGYLAVLLGAFLEEENILVLAGLAAHRGYLTLPFAIIMGLIGVGVWILYFLWKKKGKRNGFPI